MGAQVTFYGINSRTLSAEKALTLNALITLCALIALNLLITLNAPIILGALITLCALITLYALIESGRDGPRWTQAHSNTASRTGRLVNAYWVCSRRDRTAEATFDV